MSAAIATESTDMAIFRRVVDSDQSTFSPAAAEAILRLGFGVEDRNRMNALAEKNRAGRLTSAENDELDSYIRVGQALGILQSKARQSLAKPRTRRKS